MWLVVTLTIALQSCRISVDGKECGRSSHSVVVGLGTKDIQDARITRFRFTWLRSFLFPLVLLLRFSSSLRSKQMVPFRKPVGSRLHPASSRNCWMRRGVASEVISALPVVVTCRNLAKSWQSFRPGAQLLGIGLLRACMVGFRSTEQFKGNGRSVPIGPLDLARNT